MAHVSLAQPSRARLQSWFVDQLRRRGDVLLVVVSIYGLAGGLPFGVLVPVRKRIWRGRSQPRRESRPCGSLGQGSGRKPHHIRVLGRLNQLCRRAAGYPIAKIARCLRRGCLVERCRGLTVSSAKFRNLCLNLPQPAGCHEVAKRTDGSVR
jgi:hypothetical protein